MEKPPSQRTEKAAEWRYSYFFYIISLEVSLCTYCSVYGVAVVLELLRLLAALKDFSKLHKDQYWKSLKVSFLSVQSSVRWLYSRHQNSFWSTNVHSRLPIKNSMRVGGVVRHLEVLKGTTLPHKAAFRLALAVFFPGSSPSVVSCVCAVIWRSRNGAQCSCHLHSLLSTPCIS